MAQIDDLITAYTLGSLAGLDTGTGKRDVDLKDPSVYTDTELADEPLPDDLIYVTRGEGLDEKRYVGNKDREIGRQRISSSRWACCSPQLLSFSLSTT